MLSIEATISIIESLLFASSTPLKAAEISKITGVDEDTVSRLVDKIRETLKDQSHGFQIIRVAGGYQMASIPENAYYVSQLQHLNTRARLSNTALETLAIVAYKQPITRSEIEEIRGVQCGGVLVGLSERELIEEKGRKDVVGRPILYGTTDIFLRAFGLENLDDLPYLPENVDVKDIEDSLFEAAISEDETDNDL